MITRLAASLLLAISLGACARETVLPSDYAGTLRTKTPAETMIACIVQATGGTAARGVETVIDVPTAQPARRYTVTTVGNETVVTIRGPYMSGNTDVDPVVTQCLARKVG